MIANVELAGSTLPWRVLGWERVERFLEQQPWNADGGIFRISIPVSMLDNLHRQVGGYVRSVDLFGAYTHFCEGGPEEDLLCRLTKAIDIDTGSQTEDIQIWASSIAKRPQVVIISAADERVFEQAHTIRTRARAMEQNAGPVFLLCYQEDETHANFLHGWPKSQDTPNLWTHYVHEQIAWHYGGRLPEGDAFKDVKNHRDQTLVDALNSDASARFCALHPKERDSLMDGNFAGFTTQFLPESPQILIPWVARALLLNNCEEKLSTLISSTVCRPLSNRLFARVVALEMRFRDLGIPKMPNSGISAEAVYQESRARSSPHKNLYSNVDARHFESFANLIPHLPAAKRNEADELRRIRNRLAHGDPIGFNDLLKIESLEKTGP